MAFLDNTGLNRLWTHIANLMNKKVDVEEGKGLSSNDFTNEEKAKLASLGGAVDVEAISDETIIAICGAEIYSSEGVEL